MPLYFIPNKGQLDKQVAYYVQGKDKTLYFTDEGITFLLAKSTGQKAPTKLGPRRSGRRLKEEYLDLLKSPLEQPEKAGAERWVLKLEFVGANEHVRPIGETETGAVVSYFKGKPKDWKAGIPTYSKVVYTDLWPGIDLCYYGTVNRLKYEFIVHPRADPTKIRLAYRGAEKVSVDKDGRLMVKTPAGGFNDDVPMAYQEINSERVAVPLAYRLKASTGLYGFSVGEYDHNQTLVLDPAFLIYCGYIGGSSIDVGLAIAVDSKGNAHVAGYTCSPGATFPLVLGPDLTYNGGGSDAFAAKVNTAGTALDYCGYIGGANDESGWGIAMDSAGNAYISGTTTSTEATFPVAGGPDLTFNGGTYDVFVAKVNTAGTALVYCGYIGGSADDSGSSIAVDKLGNAYVTGDTYSTEATFPVTVGPDLTQNGYDDAFIAKVNPGGASLVYCGYIGGDDDDIGCGIAVDGSGNAYVTGYTYSTEATFPVKVGPDVTFDGNYDAFVAKVNASGIALGYCGYVGGSIHDCGYGISVDRSGNAYMTGYTGSTEASFPISGGPDVTYNGGAIDAFVAKIYYFEPPVHKHAEGDFDGDGAAEIAVDFGLAGAWIWDNSGWTQIATGNPENMIAANVDGNNNDEILLDLGTTGLWLWNGGSMTQLSSLNVDCLAVGDTDADGSDEVAADFGASGQWLWNAGAWSQLSGADLEYLAVANLDGTGGAEIIGDFGSIGLWVWSGGSWTQLSGVNADFLTTGNTDGMGGEDLIGDFGPTGLWLYSSGTWTQLSGVNADNAITADIDHSGDKEIIGDFALTGLWLWDSGAWAQLSGVNADDVIGADVDGDGADEVIADFSVLGLWLWNGGAWSQLSGVNPEGLLAADIDGDSAHEIFADFGSLGLWMLNGGAWSQISTNNPD